MAILFIQDPSGETRKFELDPKKTPIRIGNGEECEVKLRDGELPESSALKWNGCKIEKISGAIEVKLSDLEVDQAEWPEGWTLKVGRSTLFWKKESEESSLPETGAGVRKWKTKTKEGSEVLWALRKASETPLSVYLCGETGTGKEILANLVHSWSERKSKPFIPLHCGALAPSLAESELFGHVKGSFTGAHRDRPGALLQAHGGTLFMDEIGDLSLDLQVKLLRFLEDGEIRPVGSDRTVRSDVRIVCATHHRLDELVKQGKFRSDLYFRVASVTIDIPPIRVRPKDIGFLSKEFAQELDKNISEEALLRLQSYSWPGNVRELRHAIERAVGFAGASSRILGEEAFSFLTKESSKCLEGDGFTSLAGCLSLKEMEKEMLLRALKLAGGNRANAAKILGVARSTLFEMLKRYRIQGPRSLERGYFPIPREYSPRRSLESLRP